MGGVLGGALLELPGLVGGAPTGQVCCCQSAASALQLLLSMQQPTWLLRLHEKLEAMMP